MVAYEKFHDGQMSDYIPTPMPTCKRALTAFPGSPATSSEPIL